MNQSNTSWGVSSREPDVRSLKRWLAILRLIDKVNEMMTFALLGSIAIAMLVFFVTINFENLIFNDGTEKSCVLNGQTGIITNAE